MLPLKRKKVFILSGVFQQLVVVGSGQDVSGLRVASWACGASTEAFDLKGCFLAGAHKGFLDARLLWGSGLHRQRPQSFNEQLKWFAGYSDNYK